MLRIFSGIWYAKEEYLEVLQRHSTFLECSLGLLFLEICQTGKYCLTSACSCVAKQQRLCGSTNCVAQQQRRSLKKKFGELFSYNSYSLAFIFATCAGPNKISSWAGSGPRAVVW